MTFTQDEIDASVGKFVRTSIRREYGSLGNRRTDTTFSDIQDAAAGVFITKPKAQFYVLRLGVERLSEYLQAVKEQLEDLVGLIEGTGRYVTPVSSLSPLANARSALTALTSATSNRTSSFERVQDIPAFQRFEASTQRFLDESSRNIRQDGQLTRTPGEARSLLGTSVSTLEAQHTEVVRRTELLAGAVADYESMSLPQMLAGQVMENARDVVGQHYEDLSALTPGQRLGALRSATLDVLTARATVRGFGSLTPPTVFYLVDGALTVFADALYPAQPAALLSDYYGPYPITDSQYELHFLVEGDNLTIPIQGSFVAKIDTVIKGPYNITPTNDELRVILDNYPAVGSSSTFDVGFFNGAAQNIWDIVNDANGAFLPDINPIIAEPHFIQRKWVGEVNMVAAGPGDAQFYSTNPSVDFTDLDGAGLSIEAGDWIIIRDVASLHDEYIFAVNIVAAGQLSCTALYPGVPLTESGIQIEVGTDEVALRIRITSEAGDNGFTGAVDYQYEALRDRVAIIIPKTHPVSEQEQYDAAVTFGFVPLMESRSSLTSAADVASSMNKSLLNNTWSGGRATPRINATTVFDPYAYSGPARTNPNDFLQVVLAKFNGIGDVTTGTSVTFTVAGAETAGVEVGDIVVLRTTIHPGEANTPGVVTLVDDTQIQATMAPAITADTGVELEVGPDLSSMAFDATVVITGDTGNEGTYNVLGINDGIPFELNLDAAFPFPNGAGNAAIQFTASVGHYKLRLASVDETLSTHIWVDDAATADVFNRLFNPGIGTFRQAVGLTPYLLLPEWPAGLEEGDVFEWYNNDINTVDVSSPIVSLEESMLLVEVQDPVATDSPAVQMTLNSPIPFVRIRRQTLNTYNALVGDLNDWLGTSEASSRWFNTLRPLINPLTVNTNPTPSQVNDAKVKVEELYDAIDVLEQYLDSYEADPVDEVDTLLHTFQEKGADRATDILLEGRFSDFFGLDQNEVSYAGKMQKTIRAVQREDLPVRRDNRLTYQGSDGLLAEYDDKDFEFARDELDNDLDIDLPGG